MATAFVYLSYRPQKTARRLERYYLSLKEKHPAVEFHVVSFDRKAESTTAVERFRSVFVPRTVYGARSLEGLGYPNKTSPDWANFQDGFVDLPIILFSHQHPHYDTIWVAEDDVEFTGDLGDLLGELSATNDGFGLACTHLRMLPEGWDHTHLYQAGPDKTAAHMPQRVCFLPFFGVSRAAIQAIHDAYRRGWAGHNEMLWAAILDFAGIPIRDIGGIGPFVRPCDRNRFYMDASPGAKDFRKLGSFGTLRIRLFPGRRKNTLWHPVKTPRAFVRMSWSRTKSISRWYGNRLSDALNGMRPAGLASRLRSPS